LRDDVEGGFGMIAPSLARKHGHGSHRSVAAGVERKSIDYLVGMRAEIGYVFGRKIEYRNGTPGFDPSDTLMVRAGFFY